MKPALQAAGARQPKTRQKRKADEAREAAETDPGKENAVRNAQVAAVVFGTSVMALCCILSKCMLLLMYPMDDNIATCATVHAKLCHFLVTSPEEAMKQHHH